MSGMGGHERLGRAAASCPRGAPPGPAIGLWAQGPGKARRLAVAPWLRMACVAPLSFAALLSCTEVGPAADAPVAWKGPGSVSMDGNALIAAPYAPGAFERWEGAPCDGAADPVCELPEADAPAAMPAAAFRPFVVAGVKSLAFGLGYPEAAGSHFRVRARDAPDAGLSPVPGLERLDPGTGPALLEVSVHLLPWGLGGYVTEACGEAGCVAAPGGERTLAQADSVAATGYIKPPNAGASPELGDDFGEALALSADGSTLAVGAPREGSSATGAFAPGDAGYQAALDNEGADVSGAVTVYRRSGSAWSVEAFVKAPVAGYFDTFGEALALSADGATLAVGAPGEGSTFTGAFAPTDPGYRAALDSYGAYGAGAAYVHRRSVAGRWTLEAFIKAPKAGARDQFGWAIALSADGAALAVGATDEDSAATGAFAPTDAGYYQAALESDGAEGSGAVYVYRRWADGRWALEAFVKAPVSGTGDEFGRVALSADGSTLAVGAPYERSSATGVFAPADPGYRAALESDAAIANGAVYVHRRWAGGRWALEAFVKAPVSGTGDEFGRVALSADGSTLAVGAPYYGGNRPVRNSHGERNYGSGTAYIHRRSAGGRWALEAVFKAPVADDGDIFGAVLVLSGDGATLVVSAHGEGSSATGAFAPGAPGYQAALDSDGAYEAGATYVHRRSVAGRWTAVSLVKAPNTEADDHFGSALALSADGSVLAVGAFDSARSRPVGGDSSDAGNAVGDSGAVYLY